MKRRNGVRSRLVPLVGANLVPGDEVLNGNLRAGEVLAVDGDRGLALMRLDRCRGDLTVKAQGVHLAPPSWLDGELLPSTGQV
jgi:tRNA-modifying protein YgfZ